jgi:DNA replication protein DnaC
MLREQTFQKLSQMKMQAFSAALRDQLEGGAFDGMAFDDRVAMMVDREWTEREARRLTRRLRMAKLRQQAAIEDIDYDHPRGLDRTLMARLSSCEWIRDHQNVIISGKTGVGKTFLACALAHKACRDGYSAMYRRVPRFFDELALARADGSFGQLLVKLARTDVLILDDWGLSALTAVQRRDLLEVLDDRTRARSTIIATQLPVAEWHTLIGEPTVADAIMDRIVHCAHRLNLAGPSLRKKLSTLTEEAPQE